MLGSALEPIQILSDVESCSGSPSVLPAIVSEMPPASTHAAPDHSTHTVHRQGLRGPAEMRGSGDVEMDEGSGFSTEVMQDEKSAIGLPPGTLDSNLSTPLSSLSSLPDESSGLLSPIERAFSPEAPAESSKAASKRAKKPKAAPKAQVNGNGMSTFVKRKAAQTYSYIDPLAGLFDDDEDDYYATGTASKRARGPRKPPTPRKALPPPVARDSFLTDVQVVKFLKGKDKERQMGNCQRPRYAKWGKCTQCIAKAGGDSCRFKDLRCFPLDPSTAEIIGPGFFEDTALKDALTELPTEFNVPETIDAVEQTEHTVASILLPILFTELRHIVKNKAIRREVDSAKHRSLCDFCQSTIFAGYFFCKHCGRDFCLQCERYFSDDEDTMGTSPWPLRPEARTRLQRCSAILLKPRTAGFHYRPDLQPVSRFGREELERHCEALTNLVLGEDISTAEKLRRLGIGSDDPLAALLRSAVTERSQANGHHVDPLDLISLYTKSTSPEVPLPRDPAGLYQDSHNFICLPVDELDNARFDQTWARGEPIVVTDVGKRLQLQWTPDTIIEKFGSEQCVLVDCQTNRNQLSTVEKFFTGFKNVEERAPGIWKLKDWPATEDFKLTHPGLYNDFCDALPVPDYTRREGITNLYCHFPPGPTKPDIGPKMYNAFTAMETPGGFGSTRLHMDVADAINLMLYASPREDGTPGCAVWDLFRAEDADKVRHFLFEKYGHEYAFTDPIHAQLFYLDSGLRRELWEGYGVSSFRIYQYPGQCVFIPAGCAHQVCNLADSIKIALDFVSPHNVSRCQRLTNDFRNENFAKAWKEDVLQLYNVLWYSWLWTREARLRLERSAKAANGGTAHEKSGWRGANFSSVRDRLEDTNGPTNGDSATITVDRNRPDAAAPAIPADLVEKIIQHAIDRPDPSPPDEPRSSIATKWPAARNFLKPANGTPSLKRARSDATESQNRSQSPRVKRAARSTQVKEAEEVVKQEPGPEPEPAAREVVTEETNGIIPASEDLASMEQMEAADIPNAPGETAVMKELLKEEAHDEPEEEIEWGPDGNDMLPDPPEGQFAGAPSSPPPLPDDVVSVIPLQIESSSTHTS